MNSQATNPWVLHEYTQEEKDKLHDLYIKLKHIEDQTQVISSMRQDIRDELIPDIMDGDIMVGRIPDDVIQQIEYVESEMQQLIASLQAAQIG